MTRRLFNHVEHGLNIPGRRLAEARGAFEGESNASRKRVKGAMLAGALFNRAANLLTKAVELQALGLEMGTRTTRFSSSAAATSRRRCRSGGSSCTAAAKKESTSCGASP